MYESGSKTLLGFIFCLIKFVRFYLYLENFVSGVVSIKGIGGGAGLFSHFCLCKIFISVYSVQAVMKIFCTFLDNLTYVCQKKKANLTNWLKILLSKYCQLYIFGLSRKTVSLQLHPSGVVCCTFIYQSFSCTEACVSKMKTIALCIFALFLSSLLVEGVVKVGPCPETGCTVTQGHQ